MLRACLATLVVLAALFGVYYWWLSKQFDPPGVYVGAAIMALVVGGSLGALINSGTSYREWSLLSAARHDLPWHDGRWTAAAGTIHPVADPVIAPFSGEECVLCEYDAADRQRAANREDRSNPGSDFTGFLMNPCVVRTNQGDIKLLGFPHLTGFGERTIDSDRAATNAREFFLNSNWEDYSGLKMMNIVSAIKEAWNDEDGYVRKNVRLTTTRPEAFFPAGAAGPSDMTAAADGAAAAGELPPADDPSIPPQATTFPVATERIEAYRAEELDAELGDQAFEDDDDDDGDGDEELNEEYDEELADEAYPSRLPILTERRVKVGDRVCAIGIYNGQQRGLVPGGLGADRFVKLIRGDLAKVERDARSSTFGRFFGGLVVLALVHAVAYGVVMANRLHPAAVKERQREAVNAIGKADLAALEKLVARGLRVNERDGSNETLLSKASQPVAVQWLIEHGADVDAKTNGRTRLMDAAYLGQTEVVKVLIDAKANLDEKSDTDNRLTASEFARLNGHEDIVAMLRAAGAREVGPTVPPK